MKERMLTSIRLQRPRSRGRRLGSASHRLLALVAFATMLISGCGGSDGGGGYAAVGSGGGPGGGGGGGTVPTPPIAYLELSPKAAGVPLSDVGVIHFINPNGQGDTPLTGLPPVSFGPPRWSRDGSLIAATGVLPNQQEPISTVFTFLPSGANFTKVTDVAVQPAGFPGAFNVFAWWSFNPFSPDRQSLALTPIFSEPSQPYLFGTVQLISLNQNPAGVTTLISPFNLNSDGNGFGLDWSPTSNFLVGPSAQSSLYFTICPSPYPAQPVDVVELISGSVGANATPSQVTNILSADPIDQNDLAFVCSTPSLSRTISKVLPAFSPDGTRIAYVQWNVDNTSIPSTVTTSLRMIDLSGQNPRIVQEFPNQVSFGVSWSPDGRQLVFDQGVAVPLITYTNFQAVFPFLGSNGLWLMSVDNCLAPVATGTDPTVPCGILLPGPITPSGVHAVAPSWNWGK